MKMRFVALSGAAAACFAIAAPAEAKTCPSGQILRVSKNVCMDKDAAMKLGIVRGGGKSAAPKASKAVTAKVEPEAGEAATSRRKVKAEPPPEKSAKVAPEKILNEPKPARAVEPPKTESKAVEAPEPAGAGKNVRVIPLSATVAPPPAAAQLAPLEPPKTLTPSPFGSLGAGSLGGGAPAAAPAPALGGGLGGRR